MKLPPFDYACPETLAEAADLLAAGDGDARIIGGGQSLLPMMALRMAAPTLLLDLRRVPGLHDIEVDDDGVRLGASVRWCDILNSERLALSFPLLPAAIRHVAHYQIRNRGTVGGSLAHADPASELICIAMTCDALIEVTGSQGARELTAAELIIAPIETALAEDEIIAAIRFPAFPAQCRWGFDEFALRHGDLALAAVAVFYDLEGDRIVNAHVGVMGATETPRRVVEAEAALNGRESNETTFAAAASAAASAIDPTEDIHASADYRRALVATLLERSLQASYQREGVSPK
jgi:carbon-monoxide dehydrogenase medium subunit